MLTAEYVLPLKWSSDDNLEELSAYLDRMSRWIDVTVVDGSPEPLYARHRAAWPERVRQLKPEPWPGGNGKVAGVLTGVRHSRHERVVLADDDVRYGLPELDRLLELLETADLVRPQNYFVRLPWHARWDSARSLLNRAVAADYPGTFGVRRSILLDAGGYDGDVLFENLELIRTVRAMDGREVVANDLFVGRTPPDVRHFASQRVRQAFDDFAQPARLAVELGMLPVALAAARRPRYLAALAAASILLAEVGRRRARGRSVYPATAPLWAPAWVLERAVCVWIAVYQRLRGGVSYSGSRLRRAANSTSRLKKRLSHESS
jgi:hypothetical protein